MESACSAVSGWERVPVVNITMYGITFIQCINCYLKLSAGHCSCSHLSLHSILSIIAGHEVNKTPGSHIIDIVHALHSQRSPWIIFQGEY